MNKAQFSEPVHEEADSRAGCADHFRQHLLTDPGNRPFGLAFLAKMSEQQEPLGYSYTPIKEPPHWMFMWPFDPKTSGLPTTPKQTGTWIMYAGTPWAHLMINPRP